MPRTQFSENLRLWGGRFPVYFHFRVSAVSRCPGGDGVLTSVSEVSRVSRPLVSQWGGFVGAVPLGGVLARRMAGWLAGWLVGCWWGVGVVGWW